MEPLIAPVDPKLVERELVPRCFLRDANNGGTQIYHFFGDEAPHAMRELGRLREEAFRAAGGGTGRAYDTDRYDTGSGAYKQLVVWDPAEKIMLGGYRYSVPGGDTGADTMGATRDLFTFSPRFIEEYLPRTIELGRSFVRVNYQSSAQRRKSLYVLDNLWDGLGALVKLYPEVEGFFGKVTMYPHYQREARDILLYFLSKHFPDSDRLVRPKDPLPLTTPLETLHSIFPSADYRTNFEILNAQLQQRGEKVPPLIKSYIGLSNTMRVFGTARNRAFGDVEETGIMIRISDIFEEKIRRHVDSFTPPSP